MKASESSTIRLEWLEIALLVMDRLEDGEVPVS
jgi:hypothetical protein